MKKLASILLLLVLMFNWFGYRLVSDYFENKADIQLASLIDENNYNEADLISIKVPASLPYGVNSANFERTDGNIDINGVNYKYVKRRFYNDTLELLCIPNIAKTGIQNARDEFYKLANDFVSNNSSSKKATTHTHTVKISTQDYTDDHFLSYNIHFDSNATQYFSLNIDVTSFNFLQRLNQPPEA
ncbi:MAG: hypothetical protein KGL19_08580 [Bacteroidota bacterium]|nr:hypothetical protein [Bacteroidota bacterium]